MADQVAIFFQIIIPLASSPMAAWLSSSFWGVELLSVAVDCPNQPGQSNIAHYHERLQGLYYTHTITESRRRRHGHSVRVAYLFGSRYMIQGIAMTVLKM